MQEIQIKLFVANFPGVVGKERASLLTIMLCAETRARRVDLSGDEENSLPHETSINFSLRFMFCRLQKLFVALCCIFFCICTEEKAGKLFLCYALKCVLAFSCFMDFSLWFFFLFFARWAKLGSVICDAYFVPLRILKIKGENVLIISMIVCVCLFAVCVINSYCAFYVSSSCHVSRHHRNEIRRRRRDLMISHRHLAADRETS